MVRVIDFVNSLTSKLDKLYGSRSVFREGESFLKIDDYDYIKKELEGIEKEVGETLYLLDKGKFAIIDFILSDETNIINRVRGNLFRIEFEDFSIYFRYPKKYLDSPDWYRGNYFINVREVHLPLKKKLVLNTVPRIYVFSGKDGKIYKTPSLIFPKRINDFLKWEKKRKVIGVTPESFWDRNENIILWGEYLKSVYIPKWNLKSDSMISDYIDYLDKDYLPKYQKGKTSKSYKLDNIIELSSISQRDVFDFEAEMNGRYRVIK